MHTHFETSPSWLLHSMLHFKPSAVADRILLDAIENRALPWIDQHGMSRVVIALDSYEKMKDGERSLPPGMELTPFRARGRRVPVRERPYGMLMTSAHWPKDGMEVKRFPMVACIISGTADLRLGKYILRCPEGSFVLIPPGTPHPNSSAPHFEGLVDANRRCSILWFSPIGAIMRCWICNSEPDRHTGIPAFYLSQKNLIHYLNALFQETSEDTASLSTVRRSLLMVLLASIKHEIESGRFFRTLPNMADLQQPEEKDAIVIAQNYVRQHLSEPITLDSVARIAYLSRSQFAKRFREQTGETFYTFLHRCRLEEAKASLMYSGVSVAAVGQNVGLKPRRFVQIFQHETGMTPTAYRKKYANGSGEETSADN